MESLHRPLSRTSAHLSDVLNPSGDHRDSAYFSQNGDHSKHTSTASCNTGSLFNPSPSGYHSTLLDKTPSPVATHAGCHPMISPTSSMSVASMVSPTTSTSVDQSMLRKLDRPSEQTLTHLNSGESLSRRGSVDSRINHDFRDMRLASSPYTSQNQSTTSIQNSLNAQRNPGNGTERLSTISRNSNSYQPSIARFAVEPPKQVRTAPTITGPATGSIAHAAEPTKGQAWAFPDEPIHKTTSRSNLQNIDHDSINQTSFLVDSRRSSLAESLNSSSRYTDTSQLPYGQRRLEDGMPEYQRLSRASSEFHGASHHHHSLQSRAVSDLRDDDGESPGSTTPYSRTPELRVSHKLAERKRRTEMKHLFEDLRDLMPQERGAKASKWEILTKAIEMHHEQRNHISNISEAYRRASNDLELIRREAISLREENARLRDELSMMAHGQHAGGPAPPPPLAPQQQPQQSMAGAQPTPQFSAYPSSHGPHAPRTELPPLRSLGAAAANGAGSAQTSDSMTGVQYHHDVQRVNSYSGRF